MCCLLIYHVQVSLTALDLSGNYINNNNSSNTGDPGSASGSISERNGQGSLTSSATVPVSASSRVKIQLADNAYYTPDSMPNSTRIQQSSVGGGGSGRNGGCGDGTSARGMLVRQNSVSR